MEPTVLLFNILSPVSKSSSEQKHYEVAEDLGVSAEVAKRHLEVVRGSSEEEEEMDYDLIPMMLDIREIKRIAAFAFYDSEDEKEMILSKIFLEDGSSYNVDLDFELLTKVWLQVKYKTDQYLTLQNNVNNEEQDK